MMNINYKFEGFIGVFDNAVDNFKCDKIITTWVEFVE